MIGIPGHARSNPVPELNLIPDCIFVKPKAIALKSEAFSEYIRNSSFDEFCIVNTDAAVSVKYTFFNMIKAGYNVHVISIV